MSFVAVAVGGGALLSAGVGMYAANKSAGAQSSAADAATAEQRRQYDITRGDQKPWMDAGSKAITTLGGMVMPGGELWKEYDGANFTGDPGYQERMKMGTQAVERSAAARGGALGGGTLKDLTQFGQTFGSNEYQKVVDRFNTNRTMRYNQLAGVAGAGQQSVNTMAQVGQNTATNIGNNEMYKGNARASGYVGMANAFNQGINGISNVAIAKQQGII